MIVRVQGGTRGLLSALDSGRIEVDGKDPVEIGFCPHNAADKRLIERRLKRRLKKRKAYSRAAIASRVPF